MKLPVALRSNVLEWFHQQSINNKFCCIDENKEFAAEDEMERLEQSMSDEERAFVAKFKTGDEDFE